MVKKIKMRFFATAMTMVLTTAAVFSLAPSHLEGSLVHAASGEKTITLGTDVINAPSQSSTNGWEGSYVWYGSYENKPIKFRVLDPDCSDFRGYDENNQSIGYKTLLLDSDSSLFMDNFGTTQDWYKCELKNKLNNEFLNSAFTPSEASSIIRSVSVPRGEEERCRLTVTVTIDTKVFLLDVYEATNEKYGYVNDASRIKDRLPENEGDKQGWLLRSKHSAWNSGAYMQIGTVKNDGSVSGYYNYTGQHGVSPAINLNKEKILFSSLVSGQTGSYDAEYKLTIIDDGLDIKVEDGKNVTVDGYTLNIPYTMSGSNVSNNTCVSVLVTDKEYTDKNAVVKQYGTLDSGTGTFNIDNSITGTCGKDFHIYLIAENRNGIYETDYASVPFEIKENFNLNKVTNNENGRDTTETPSGDQTVNADSDKPADAAVSEEKTPSVVNEAADTAVEVKTENIDNKQKNTKISKVVSRKKSVTVSWKKQTKGITGYEIQYSTDKSFKNDVKKVTINKAKTTSKTIKKLTSKKKYYVRIRTFKKSGGEKVYSKWSKVKRVKVK